jgi:hypothetical protein
MEVGKYPVALTSPERISGSTQQVSKDQRRFSAVANGSLDSWLNRYEGKVGTDMYVSTVAG